MVSDGSQQEEVFYLIETDGGRWSVGARTKEARWVIYSIMVMWWGYYPANELSLEQAQSVLDFAKVLRMKQMAIAADEERRRRNSFL